MNRILLFGLLLSFFMIGIQQDAYSQTRKRSSSVDKYFDESGGFAHRLWYGGGFNLGFSGSNTINQFTIGISPMVGYKITEDFSIGPRVSLNTDFIKGIASDGQTRKVNPLSWSIGAFTRYKVFQSFFAHVEYEFENTELPILSCNAFACTLFYDNVNQEIQTVVRQRDNVYLGVGYNSSMGLWGWEMLLLYNALVPEDSLELPFSFRFGLTYNF
jgi:hypothetical protein